MKQTINFKKAYERQHKGSHKRSAKTMVAVLLLTLCFLGIGGSFAVLRYQIYQTELKTAELEQYLQTSPEVTDYAEKLALQEQVKTLQAENDTVQTLTDYIRNRPGFDVPAYAALDIRRGASMELLDMTYTENGVLSVKFLCPTSAEVPDYVEAVRADGFFRSVRYNGYALEEGYLFTMICELREVMP